MGKQDVVKNMNQNDYYRVLGIDSKADLESLKEAYRKLAFKYHPDRNQGDSDAVEKMKTINEAYAVLSDPIKRSQYDLMKGKFGAHAFNHFRQAYSGQDILRGTDIRQVFEEMSKNFGFRGFDAIVRDIYTHGYGTGGMFIFGSGSGGIKKTFEFQPGGKLGKAGKYLFEKITGAHLPESGNDLNDEIAINHELAENGGPYAYYHRQQDKKLIINIPRGVKDGQRVRLAGMGGKGKGGGQAGDLYLKIKVKKSWGKKLMNFFSER